MDQVTAITKNLFIPRAVDNIFTSIPLFSRLVRRAIKISGGAQIQHPLILAKNTSATSYRGSDILPVEETQEIDAAIFDWAQYSVTIQIDGRDDMRNQGPEAVINLIRLKVQVAEQSLRERMGGDLYLDGTGNGGKNLLGLLAADDDGTTVATYGQISRTTYPNWQSTVSANGGVGRALTLSLMQSAFSGATKDNVRPNILLTSHGVYNKYLSLLQPGQRFMDAETASAGFQNLLYQGRPLVVDEQISTTPNHRIFMLNDHYLELYLHRTRAFRFIPFLMVANQDVIVGKILVAGNLVCASPRLQARIDDIDPTL